ncbi:MAG: RHS domain-containing protein, partial [Kiritimatiellae bacterium]|nr:RHS domain-containing protein [Kiritimatiellia bacterium]
LVAVANDEESFEILVDNGHSLADVTADGTPLRVYMRGPGVDSWLGFVDMTGSSPVPYFYVTDHLGSVLAVTDANGNLVERYEYDAWGKVLSVTDADGNALSRSAIGNRILWQAREYSWTTGLYYFRNRWYDPTIGRWISKDPIGIQGGLNLYEFCGCAVLNSIDPFGYAWIRTRLLDVKGASLCSRVNLPGNFDLRHREIFFEDGEVCEKYPKSVGYGPNGVHEDVAGIPYNNTEYRHYDDKLMRKAVEAVVKTGKWTREKYNFVTHNCQDFVEAVIKEYNKLEKNNSWGRTVINWSQQLW